MPGSGHRTVPARRLTVLVGTLPIEDGQTRPPVVGEIGHYPLVFAEAQDDDDGVTPGNATVVTAQVRAEPVRGGAPRPGGWPERRPRWPTLLHGDGWSANWSAPRPVTGQVRLRGVLVGDLGISSRQWVRGWIVSAHVVTETIDTAAADQHEWRPIPGLQRLRAVETAPRWFDHGTEPAPLPPGVTEGWVPAVRRDPYVVETGVLVVLDLDDVPPLPLRPSIVPTAVSASGDDLWVLDRALPLAVRISVTSSQVAAHPWPGTILTEPFAERRVHADADGCWISGPDGVHRLDTAGGQARPVLDGPVHTVHAVERSLVVLEPERARILTGDDVVDVPLPPSTGPGVVDDDGVVLLLSSPGRLARLALDGSLTEGPPDPVLDQPNATLLDGALVAVPDQGRARVLRRVLPGLGLGPPVLAGSRLHYLFAAGGRVFGCGHTPDVGTRPGDDVDWAPLPGPVTHPDGGRYDLLTELDPDTGDAVGATLVAGLPDHLAVDGRGTVWLGGRSGLRRCPDGPGGVAEPFDVAALLDGP